MPEVLTHLLQPGELRGDSKQVYNGLDCCVTFEVHSELQRLFNAEPLIYNFERALQGPALEMMMRGFRVDQYERQKGVAALTISIDRLNNVLQRYAHAVWGKPLNPRSTKQLQEFFYSAMRMPEVWISQKGVRKLSMNRETLEKLEVYFHAMPIIATILAIRDLSKKREILETEVDSDSRMRTSYNIAGTETGRWSSSSNAFGTGTNLQNIPPRLRKVFVADDGWKLCGIDLEQAESREIGFLCGVLFGDWSYLDACEGGDLHTTTAKLVWPGLGWTGDPAKDRALAEQNFYREFSYRDMSKRGGHGTNYYGTPWTMSRHLKVPVGVMVSFQKSYFGAYPCIPRFHRWVAQEIQTKQYLETFFGRGRHFFGRPNDDTTLREAIAYCGQSPTADRLNLAMLNIWKEMGTVIRLTAQVHDALYFMYRIEDDEAAIIKRALELIQIPMTSPSGRVYTIPGEAKVGWNWGNAHNPGKPLGPNNEFNPNGLVKWKGHDPRSRQSGLDRVL